MNHKIFSYPSKHDNIKSQQMVAFQLIQILKYKECYDTVQFQALVASVQSIVLDIRIKLRQLPDEFLNQWKNQLL